MNKTIPTGLKAILSHNETAQPNDELLNVLKAAVPQFFDKDGNFKSDKFQDELKKSNIAESRDGYKLGFVGKDYARLQVERKSETMIVPDTKHNSLPENANNGNIFITGDNIDALRHLVNAYGNQIKLIYIDPPYNTGKEFVYSDKFEFSDEKLKSTLGYTDEEIVRLKSIQGKSSHSAWLTFMYPRLKIAQRLLRDDGVIFVSIDDNEQANLKLLMDDIFGESNFVALLTRRSMHTVRNSSKDFNKNTDFLLVYLKNKCLYEQNKELWLREKVDKSINYRMNDNDGRGFYKLDPIYARNYFKPYRFTFKNGIIWEAPQGSFPRYSEETLRYKEEHNELNFDGNEPRAKRYLNEVQEGQPPDALMHTINVGFNSDGTKTLAQVLGNDKVFSQPKPVELIKYLINLLPNGNHFILDFFAGSATTAHAVMQLNAEDGGNRKFIMVQIDEETNPDSEARKVGYNTIDEIARDRIVRAGKKILADYESDLAKQSNGWDKDIGFKHYRLITPDIKTIDKIIEFNPEEVNLIADDMIKPFAYKDTNTKGLDTILTTWLIDDGYRFDTPIEEIVFGKYTAHYVREAATLYLINQNWDTKALIALLNQIGKNQLLVKTIVVYPYSFAFEAMRELKTNIKTNLDPSPVLIERF